MEDLYRKTKGGRYIPVGIEMPMKQIDYLPEGIWLVRKRPCIRSLINLEPLLNGVFDICKVGGVPAIDYSEIAKRNIITDDALDYVDEQLQKCNAYSIHDIVRFTIDFVMSQAEKQEPTKENGDKETL